MRVIDKWVKIKNMALDIRIDEKLEMFIYELENNVFCKRLIDIDLQLIQNNIRYEEGGENE